MSSNDAGRPSPAAAARRAGDRLAALRGDPGRQAEAATALLATERTPAVMFAALNVLESHVYPPAHDALAAAAEWLFESPKRRDAGGMLRAAALRALRPIASRDDVPLFDRATLALEPTPQDGAAPAILRAAGLAGLVSLDPETAAIRAAELLADTAHISAGNGEPALTAVRTLAALEQYSALALFLLSPARDPMSGRTIPGEIVAEAYRGLAPLPGALLLEILQRLEDLRRPLADMALLGYCDLLVDHDRDDALLPRLANFLASTTALEVYHSVATTMAASRRPPLVLVLLEHASTAFGRDKLAILVDALALIPGSEATAARAGLNARLADAAPA